MELLKNTDAQSLFQEVRPTSGYPFSLGLLLGYTSPKSLRPFRIPLFHFKQRPCLSIWALVENYAILQRCKLQVIKSNAKKKKKVLVCRHAELILSGRGSADAAFPLWEKSVLPPLHIHLVIPDLQWDCP